LQKKALKLDPLLESAPEKVSETVVLKKAMSKTHDHIFGRLKNIFSRNDQSEIWDELEEILYTSDMGPQTVSELLEQMKKELSRSDKKDYGLLQKTLSQKIEQLMTAGAASETNLLEDVLKSTKPFVIMIVGVNGAGKTTTIGKLSAQFAQNGLKVLVAAGDTFRAAASDQLKAWSERAQVEIFTGAEGGDPSGVAFDAVAKAKSKQFDVVIIDTAGRLHTQTNLMEELKKVKRVIQKQIPEAPHETLIVLDANSGQNALIQAKQFHEALTLTGAILTKMDGSAKGGVAIGVVSEVKIPIKYLGVGEKIGDLRPFHKKEFIESLISES
ncbi:MAG: signal recognition particle-docking protein FtsY, partial [Pseudobdellovibrionaceae bacterium]